MRRWFAIFLLIVLPLQTTWAAVGNYCQHETGPAAQHFGHHEHQHQVGLGDDGKGKNGRAVFAVDVDCGFCHPCYNVILNEAPASSVLRITAMVNAIAEPHLPSAALSPPDRPNWQRLV